MRLNTQYNTFCFGEVRSKVWFQLNSVFWNAYVKSLLQATVIKIFHPFGMKCQHYCGLLGWCNIWSIFNSIYYQWISIYHKYICLTMYIDVNLTMFNRWLSLWPIHPLKLWWPKFVIINITSWQHEIVRLNVWSTSTGTCYDVRLSNSAWFKSYGCTRTC